MESMTISERLKLAQGLVDWVQRAVTSLNGVDQADAMLMLRGAAADLAVAAVQIQTGSTLPVGEAATVSCNARDAFEDAVATGVEIVEARVGRERLQAGYAEAVSDRLIRENA